MSRIYQNSKFQHTFLMNPLPVPKTATVWSHVVVTAMAVNSVPSYLSTGWATASRVPTMLPIDSRSLLHRYSLSR